MTALLRFWIAHRGELAQLTAQHLVLVLVSTLIAAGLGVPAGIAAARNPRFGRPLLAIANIAQTIPSLALFGFLLPLPFIGGLGPRTALVTLTLYALLPIVRGTVAGLQSVDGSVVEAGVAMGMTPRQLLWIVELPLAVPSIVAGIRVAAVIGVGTATIAAAIGAGGLGEYIFRGLSMVDPVTILAGAIPAALLAVVVDGLLAGAESLLRTGRWRVLRNSAAVACVAALALSIPTLRGASAARATVGSKNFTEQVVLGELAAQAIEAEGLPVARKLNLGGTFICDRALRTGDIDLYVEYTGTAVTAVFHETVPHDPARALARARERYAEDGISVLDPLGFDNTFAVLVRSQDAAQLGLRTIGDLRRVAPDWRAGFGYEFLQRDDGYRGLADAYGLRFAAPPRGMDVSLIYKALSDRRVDVIAGDATSAQIDTLHLQRLDDTSRYFPPYDAVPVARTASALAHPEIRRAMKRLAGRISVADMRALNRAIDVDRRDPAAVAAAFLKQLPRE